MVYRSPVIQNPLDACFAIPFFAETRTLMRLCLLSGSVHSFVILRFREISRDNRRLHEEVNHFEKESPVFIEPLYDVDDGGMWEPDCQ